MRSQKHPSPPKAQASKRCPLKRLVGTGWQRQVTSPKLEGIQSPGDVQTSECLGPVEAWVPDAKRDSRHMKDTEVVLGVRVATAKRVLESHESAF